MSLRDAAYDGVPAWSAGHCHHLGTELRPLVAQLFQAGFGLSTVAVVMGLGSTMAAIVLLLLKIGSENSLQPVHESQPAGSLKEARA